MALFKKDSQPTVDAHDFSWVLVNPRITEKAAMVSENNVYTFDVATRANKIQVKKAIQATYNVTPKKVNIISAESRKVMKRGRRVHQTGSKKAMIFLKKGDSIDLA